MWGETTVNENAAGWNGEESSFMTDRKPDSKATTLGERLPVPVTITNLIKNLSQQDDKYVIGNFRFATVLTVGQVKEIHEDGTTFTYILHDPENEDSEYRTVKYDSELSNFDSSLIIEGSRVRAIGKLKSFDDCNTIMLFNINPLTDDKDYTIFQLEAEAARLFFQKNMNDKLKSETFSRGLHGMLALPKSRGGQQAPQNGAKSENRDRIYPAQAAPVKKEQNLRERVHAVLKAIPEESREQGSNIYWIAEQVQETNTNELRNCIAGMVECGMVYTTVDDDHFSSV
uniref:RPA_C domain-containing protein n=1 Tax=Caenorhabditis tropicalis TaxID=1561998 RepID=A0A1I7TWZ2_9PELO